MGQSARQNERRIKKKTKVKKMICKWNIVDDLKLVHKEKRWREFFLVLWLVLTIKISEFITGERKR